MDGLHHIPEKEEQKIMELFDKLNQIEPIVNIFVQKMAEKRINIKNDEFFGVRSPFQMASAFSRASK